MTVGGDSVSSCHPTLTNCVELLFLVEEGTAHGHSAPAWHPEAYRLLRGAGLLHSQHVQQTWAGCELLDLARNDKMLAAELALLPAPATVQGLQRLHVRLDDGVRRALGLCAAPM